MSRHTAGMTAAGAGTTVRPILGLLATATATPQLREIGLFNTTAVSCIYQLVQLTGGTPGATVTSFEHRQNGPAAVCLAKQLWTADGGTIVPTGYRMVLGAAIGSAAILTFGDDGLACAVGATIALGLVPIGTGQICEVYFVWDE